MGYGQNKFILDLFRGSLFIMRKDLRSRAGVRPPAKIPMPQGQPQHAQRRLGI